MDLNAVTNPKASGKLLLFKDTRPIVGAVAKGLREALPVKPVAAAGGSLDGVLSVVKAMNEDIAQLAASIKGPVQKAAPATPPAPAATADPTSGLNVMLGSEVKRSHVNKVAEAAAGEPAPARHPSTEGQLRREAEARAQARKNAAQADAERVQVKKAGGRVRVLKVLDPSLSDAALMALSHLVTKYEAAGRQSVPLDGSDLSRALDIPLTAAQAGFTELIKKGHIRSAKSPLGITHVTPSRAATGEA